jgi:phage tail tape-measure protein
VNELKFDHVWENMFKGGSLWAGVIAGGAAQLQDTIALTSGRMKTGDFAVSSTKNATMALGTMAGVECGAIVGTALMPGFGTMLGSIIGGVIGDRIGAYVGAQAGQLLFKGLNRPTTQPSSSSVHLAQ